jgi:hypothetical protein
MWKKSLGAKELRTYKMWVKGVFISWALAGDHKHGGLKQWKLTLTTRKARSSKSSSSVVAHSIQRL